MRPLELLELRRPHEGAAEGVVEMEEDGVKSSESPITGKPAMCCPKLEPSLIQSLEPLKWFMTHNCWGLNSA